MMVNNFDEIVCKLQDEITELEERKKSILKDIRDSKLIKSGLYKKEFYTSDKNKNVSDYPYKEWDQDKGKFNYYKKIAIDVTEEEMKVIDELYNKQRKLKDEIKEYEEKGDNKISALLMGIGLLSLIVLLFVGVITLFNDSLIGLILCAIGVLVGGVCMGISEIIKILDNSNSK